MFPPTVIWRHRRENLKKCSLKGLEGRPDLLFLTYPTSALPDLSSYVLLKVGAPPLGPADAGRGLFLLDATWRLAQIIAKVVPQKLEERSLPPHFRTAYPRRQTECPDPATGLASVEALYLAYALLGRRDEALLANYPWKEAFLTRNGLQGQG